MIDAHEYAMSVGVPIANDGGTKTIYSPTFYLRADVQGIVSEVHARRIMRDFFEKIGHTNVDIMAAPTNVDAPDLQANALLHRVKVSKGGTFVFEPFDLPAGYVLVRANDGFECGVAPDGRVSS